MRFGIKNTKIRSVMKNIELKKDKYKRARGGHSRFLNIFCSKCGDSVVLYQKDGPGSLKRTYLDRILSPEDLKGLDSLLLKSLKPLSCKKCKQVLGVPFVYAKEKRLSFRLFEGSVSKKITKIESLG